MPEPEFTEAELVVGLTEWQRRWLEDPDAFYDEQTAMATAPQTYGEECGPYLAEIIRGQRA